MQAHRTTLAALLTVLAFSSGVAAQAHAGCRGPLLDDRADDQLGAPVLSNADLRHVSLETVDGRQAFAIDLASLRVDALSSGPGVDYLVLPRVRNTRPLRFLRVQTARAIPRYTFGSATVTAGVVTLDTAGSTQGDLERQGLFDPPRPAIVDVELPARLPAGERPIEHVQALSLLADGDTARVRVITPAGRLDEAHATDPGVTCRRAVTVTRRRAFL